MRSLYVCRNVVVAAERSVLIVFASDSCFYLALFLWVVLDNLCASQLSNSSLHRALFFFDFSTFFYLPFRNGGNLYIRLIRP